MSEPEHKVLNLRTVFGLDATVTTPSAATDGAYVEMDIMVQPGATPVSTTTLSRRRPTRFSTAR